MRVPATPSRGQTSIAADDAPGIRPSPSGQLPRRSGWLVSSTPSRPRTRTSYPYQGVVITNEKTPPRRPRLSDRETAQRMIEAALTHVHTHGLQVGIDQLGYEELIVSAGVTRSAVYRRWPSKEAFLAELLVTLAERQEYGLHHFSDDAAPALAPILGPDVSWAATPRGRRGALVRLARAGSQANYESTARSQEDRNNIALAALLRSSSDELRARALDLLRASESEYVERRSAFYRVFLAIVGYRLKPQVTMRQFVTLGSALVQGLTLQAAASAEQFEDPVLGDPFGIGISEGWTTASLGFTALMLELLEPDPDFEPDQARLGALLATLAMPSVARND